MAENYVPWSKPTECPTCTGAARYRDVEGEREWDPVYIDPTDLEESLRVAEGPISLIRRSLTHLAALDDPVASELGKDTQRLLVLWDRFREVAQIRVERARSTQPREQEQEASEGDRA